MTYVALRRLKVGHDDDTDTPIYREVGDEVPEADGWSWQARRTYEREGHMKDVPDQPASPRREKGSMSA